MRTITPDELIEELKSGRWRKARKQLARFGNRRCCLGVACELIGVEFSSAVPMHNGVVGQVGPGWGNIPYDIVDQYASWLVGRQDELSSVNDNTAGWDKAIEILEGIPA